MSNVFDCKGCDSAGFTWRGFVQHVRHSKDDLCRTAFEARYGFKDKPEPEGDSALEPAIVPFEGDALGSAEDYAMDDFGQAVKDDTDMAPPETSADVSEEDDDLRVLQAELEDSWEPDRPEAPLNAPVEDPEVPPDTNGPAGDGQDLADQLRDGRTRAEEPVLGEGDHGPTPSVRTRFSEKHRSSRCGQKLDQREAFDDRYRFRVNGDNNPYDLLAIEGIVEALNLSYKSSDGLNKIIDENFPGRPFFVPHEIVTNGEAFEFFARDIIECIKALWGDMDFVIDLIFEPERHYADKDRTIRIYHDMHTGKWWWDTHKAVEARNKGKKCTVVPFIISSDKTQLTQFRNETAYPVYITIGNLPKHIRRKPSRQGQILLAYLPTTKLDHITNKAARRRTLINLFHNCMKFIVKPLEKAGIDGIVMVSGDGAARHCFPIFAGYVGDYPEQVLVSVVKNGDCVICDVDRDLLEDLDSTGPPRDVRPVLEALEKVKDGPRAFVEACSKLGIKAVSTPFCKDLPHVNIYDSITPDILHQLYQGVIKHLVLWVRSACTDVELDARCRRLSPNHNIRLFLKGLSPLSRITGTEHDQICRILLGLIMDIRLPNNLSNVKLVRAVRAALDFLYLAKCPVHTSETLERLDDALGRFHANRDIFISLEIRSNFNIPKFHYMGHYRHFIERFGTADNFNTEYTERLHIDLAKDAYRASNHKDEYPQMTAWLDRKEKVLQHDKYIRRRLETSANNGTASHSMKRPFVRDVYGASFFEAALSRFVIQHQHPEYTKAQIEAASNRISLPFYKVSVYHRLKFISRDPYALFPNQKDVVDSIHVEPESRDRNGKVIPGRFDTAVVNFNSGGEVGVRGYAVAQVRCIFSLPPSAVPALFPQGSPSDHFAYVEWFTPFTKAIFDRNSQLYRIERLVVHGEQQASVIPISLIRQSVHLFPKFGPEAPVHWKSSNVLVEAKAFYVNPFSDRFQYSTLF
ncbi:hypothetical protein CVT26_003097 [Gymnopilus dilepis]|uniref:C2H2-type domain-containing protein n=1 Tax=Gymnopilus dilepis TaxID=231916 RepID=A0A409Y4W6_9AGAR|nr:hypothetical protein CVT26_003097 [Gymnopilus dilepis]